MENWRRFQGVAASHRRGKIYRRCENSERIGVDLVKNMQTCCRTAGIFGVHLLKMSSKYIHLSCLETCLFSQNKLNISPSWYKLLCLLCAPAAVACFVNDEDDVTAMSSHHQPQNVVMPPWPPDAAEGGFLPAMPPDRAALPASIGQKLGRDSDGRHSITYRSD